MSTIKHNVEKRVRIFGYNTHFNYIVRNVVTSPKPTFYLTIISTSIKSLPFTAYKIT